MSKITDEQKGFISDLHLKEGKNAGEIIKAYEEKYGESPSTRIINQWKYFNESKEDDEDKKGEQGKGLEILTDDTRTVKDDVDISGDEVDDADFNKLCKNFGYSQNKMWNVLAEAKRKGYTKVNATTGDFKK